MRLLIFLFTLLLLHQPVFCQKMDYSIPKGYEKGIDKKDYRMIVDASVAVISQRYQIERVADGTIYLKAGQDMKAFNVHNLIAKCLLVKDKDHWEQVVQDHFEKMFSSIDEQKKINPADFQTVKQYLSLRIYGQDFIEQRGGSEKFVIRTDLEGAYTMLMLDLPGAFIPVDKPVFEGWQKTESEVFALAQSNVNQQPIDKVTKSFQVDNAEVEIIFLGNEDYAASYALDLIHNSPELVGQWGSVVAMPNKGLVNVCRISREKPIEFIKFIQLTQATVEQYYSQHPQPISDQYYWYYNGKFTRIQVTATAEGTINVLAPMGLSELMSVKK